MTINLGPRRTNQLHPRYTALKIDESEEFPEDRVFGRKDLQSFKVPQLPESAGAFRSWKNALLPRLAQAFNACSDAEVRE